VLRLTAEDDRVDVFVRPQRPDEELCEVARVDELPQGLAGAGNSEGVAVLYGELAQAARWRSWRALCEVTPMDQRWYDVRLLQILQ
jgi:hypothetical protein